MSLPTPDKNGFVTVQWPSKTIPHGGIMHPRVNEPNIETQKFLKVLLDESKFSIQLRDKNKYRYREPDKKNDEPPQQQICYPVVRPRTSKRRSLSAIRAVTALDDYVYKPMKRGEDREKMKDKLAKIMAFGDESAEQTATAAAAVQARLPKKPVQLPTAKEQWHELLSQIHERVEWLADMEVLGQAAEHRDIIENQIAERIRALKALGVDSECSSVRTRSGFSTTRSREPSIRSNGSCKANGAPKSVHSGRSSRSQEKKSVTSKEGSARSNMSNGRDKKCKEESVMEYQKLSPTVTALSRNLPKV